MGRPRSVVTEIQWTNEDMQHMTFLLFSSQAIYYIKIINGETLDAYMNELHI